MGAESKIKGNWGEAIALEFFRSNQYHILKQNFYYGKIGEIDLIVETPDHSTVVFVEIKAGIPGKFGPLEFWITPAKQKRLYRMAEAFIQTWNIENKNFRFDALLVEGNQKSYKIKHLIDAF